MTVHYTLKCQNQISPIVVEPRRDVAYLSLKYLNTVNGDFICLIYIICFVALPIRYV